MDMKHHHPVDRLTALDGSTIRKGCAEQSVDGNDIQRSLPMGHQKAAV
jgi:hypothetical protein